MTVPTRILAAGIDTLYASARGVINSGHLATALELRKAAEPGAEGTMWEIPALERTFIVRPYGWAKGRYPAWLSSPAIDVMLGAPEPVPPVYVQLRSAFIHQAEQQSPSMRLSESRGISSPAARTTRHRAYQTTSSARST